MMVQYVEPDSEEERRILSDRRAKVAARRRIKQRKTRRMIWMGVLILIGIGIYFVVTRVSAVHDPIAAWMKGEQEAALQNTEGIRKVVKGENRRRRLVDINGETSDLGSELP